MSVWTKLASLAAGVAGGLTAVFDGAAAVFRRDPSVAFTAALIALSAKMARADGVVTLDEVAAFERIAQIPSGEEVHVRRLFDLAKQDVAGFEGYAARIGRLFADRPVLRADVLDALYVIAGADGYVHEREAAYLARVAELLGLPERDIERIKARHLRPGARDPYVVLGVRREATDAEVRRAWLALLHENHPDRLIAHGVPEEMVNLATERTARINAAWEEVKRERGLS